MGQQVSCVFEQFQYPYQQRNPMSPLFMPRRSPKQKDISHKKNVQEKTGPKIDSDYRLVIVLGSALVLAIVIIIAIMWTSR